MVEKALALCLKERASQPASEVPSLVAFARSLHFSATPFPVAGVWSLHTGKRKGVGMCELYHTGTIRHHNGLLSSLVHKHLALNTIYHTAVLRPFACHRVHA